MSKEKASGSFAPDTSRVSSRGWGKWRSRLSPSPDTWIALGFFASWASFTVGLWLLLWRHPAIWFLSSGLAVGTVSWVHFRASLTPTDESSTEAESENQ